ARGGNEQCAPGVGRQLAHRAQSRSADGGKQLELGRAVGSTGPKEGRKRRQRKRIAVRARENSLRCRLIDFFPRLTLEQGSCVVGPEPGDWKLRQTWRVELRVRVCAGREEQDRRFGIEAPRREAESRCRRRIEPLGVVAEP